jgi:hypothetical protein
LRLIIRDGTEPGGGGGLAFDLPEVLGALGEKAQSWVWRGRDIQYVSRDERDVAVIQELAAGRALAGADLIAGLDVNATHVVHSGDSGNNGGSYTNPSSLEDPPNEVPW